MADMKILPDVLIFEWDSGNREKNLLKHGVTNKEIEEAFIQKEQYILFDERHSTLEERYLLWGKMNTGKNLSIIFTIRRDQVRVISARVMNKKERRSYEEKIKTDS